MHDHDVPRGALDEQQRCRSAAAYEAARMILGDEPDAREVIAVADWIVNGRRPPADVRVLPDESLLTQVAERLARAAESVGPIGADGAAWTPAPGEWKPYPATRTGPAGEPAAGDSPDV